MNAEEEAAAAHCGEEGSDEELVDYKAPEPVRNMIEFFVKSVSVR